MIFLKYKGVKDCKTIAIIINKNDKKSWIFIFLLDFKIKLKENCIKKVTDLYLGSDWHPLFIINYLYLGFFISYFNFSFLSFIIFYSKFIIF